MKSPFSAGLRLASPRLGLALLALPFLGAVTPAAAQFTYVIQSNYSATGLSLWSGSEATIINSSGFFGLEWNDRVSFGHIESTWVGDFGLKATVWTEGKIGYEWGFKSTSGDVSLNLPNTVTLAYTDLNTKGSTISVSQDRTLLPGQTDRIASTFSNAEFYVNQRFKIDLGIDATAAFFDSVNVKASISSVYNHLASTVGLPAGFNPFDYTLPLISYNKDNNRRIQILGGLFGIADKNLDNGVTVPLNTSPFAIGTVVEYGNITAHTVYGLNARSGNATSVTNTQDEVIAIRANLLGLATLYNGLPVNPFQPKLSLGGPLVAELEIVSLDAGLSLGLKQDLALNTNSVLTLNSNVPVRYTLANGTLTDWVTNYSFVLPEDGAGFNFTLTDHQGTTETPLQIFPSVAVAPTLSTNLDLLFSPSFRLDVLKLGLSAWGMGGGLGPVYSYTTTGSPLATVDLWSSLNQYGALAQFNSPTRGIESLVNPDANARAFDVAAFQGVNISNSTGTANYAVAQNAGTLNVTNSLFNNVTNLALSGALNFNGANNDAALRGLDLTPTGVLRLDGGSQLLVNGTIDENGVYLTDANSLRVPGFIDANGVITEGSLILGGKLTYSGADITEIGANAGVRLTDSAAYSGLHLVNRPDPTSPITDHDAFLHLQKINGALWLDGVDLTTDQGVTIDGSLVLRQGATFTAAGLDTSDGILDFGAGSTATFQNSFAPNNAGTLTGISLYLGATAGGAQVRYAGDPVNVIGSTLHLIGARPSGGYLHLTNTDHDALEQLTGIGVSSQLALLAGATQSTSAANFINAGTLVIDGAASALIVAGSLNNAYLINVSAGTLTSNGFFNAGGLQLTNNATFNAGALSNVGSNGLLSGGGIWNLGGNLHYSGNAVTGVDSATTLKFTGATSGLRQNGNATVLASNAGTLTFAGGATNDSSASAFTNTGLLQLTGTGTSFSVDGYSGNGTLELGVGSTLDTTKASGSTSSLPVDASGRLAPGASWTIAGDLRYSGPALTGLAAGSSLVLARTSADKLLLDASLNLDSGGDSFDRVDGGNTTSGLANFHDLRGNLTLNSLVTLSLADSLTLRSGASLTLDPRATLQVKGPDFTLESGSTLTLGGGNLILGGGAGQTTLHASANLDLLASEGGGELQLGRVTYASGAYTTTGTGGLDVTGTFTNSNYVVRGAGLITADTIDNYARIFAAGGSSATGTLTLIANTINNSGWLGSVGQGSLVIGDASHDTTLNNSIELMGGTVPGLLDIQGGLTLLRTTVNGGGLTVGSSGALFIGNGTSLNVDTLTLNGDLDLAANNHLALNSMTTSTDTDIQLHDGATLTLGSATPFTNNGNVTLSNGAGILGTTIRNNGRYLFDYGSSSLSGLSNLANGTLAVDGSTLTLTDSAFENAGFITLGSVAPSATPPTGTLRLAQDFTLTGGGFVQLGGQLTLLNKTDASGAPYTELGVVWKDGTNTSGAGVITSVSGEKNFTNVDNTIQGRGNLGDGLLNLVNAAGGTIRSLGSDIGGTLVIEPGSGGFRNLGTLSVDTGTTLRIDGDFLSVSGGTFTEGSYVVGGTLLLPEIATWFDASVPLTFNSSSARITDGTNDAGIRNITATGGLTITGSGTYTRNTTTESFTSSGKLAALFGGTISLTGSQFTNYNSATHTLTGGRFEIDASTLRFDGADIVTNAADIRLGGTYTFTDQSGQSALRNFATNTGHLELRHDADLTLGAGISTFTNTGDIVVRAGSTLDLNNAAYTAGSATNASLWIGGTVTAPTTPTNLDHTHVTLYGPDASWDFGAETLPYLVGTGGKLTFAGGLEAYYAPGVTIQNNGTLEFGSPTTRTADGTTIRSSAFVMFGSGSSNNFVTINGGTTRLYSGDTDDLSTASNTIQNSFWRGFYVDRLAINGTFDANGTITMGPNSRLNINGVFGNSTSATQFLNNGTGGLISVTGGLDLSHAVTRDGVGFNFTYTAGSPVRLDGVNLVLDSFSLGFTNIGNLRLANNSSIRNSAGANLLNFQTNSGTVELANQTYTIPSFSSNSGTVSLTNATLTAGSSFNNTGTVTSDNSSTLITGIGGFTNRGTLSEGLISTTGEFINKTGATATSTVAAAGDFTNETGATFSGSATSGGVLRNQGTMQVDFFTNYADSPYLIGVYNSGNLTFRGSTFKNAVWVPQVGHTPAHYEYTPGYLYNTGTLNFYGLVEAGLSGNGTFRINDPDGLAFDTRLTGSNYIEGAIFVDAGRLHLTENSDLGGNPLNPASITVATGAALQLDNLTLPNWVNLKDGALLQAGSTGSSIGYLTLDDGTPTITGSLAIIGGGGLGGLNLGGGGTLSTNGILSLKGTLTGVGNVHVSGAGHFLALEGGSTLDGTLTIDDGAYLSFRGQFDSDAHVTGPIMHLGHSSVTTTTGVNSVISGTAAAMIHGNVIFGGNHTYTGLTTINTGASLTLGSGFTSGSVAGDIYNLGALTFNRSNDLTIGAGNSISGSGSITQAGSGILTIAHASFLDRLTVANGSVLIDGTSLGTSGTLPTVTNQSKLGFAHSNAASNFTTTVDGPGRFYNFSAGNLALRLTSDADRLYHAGSGTLTLTGVNAIANGITVGSYRATSGGPSATDYSTPGSLALAGESNFATAPASYVGDWLTLHDGGTLRFTGDTTLAATRGLTVSAGTIEVGATTFGSFVLPYVVNISSPLNGSSFTVSSLTKTGLGTLNLPTPTDPFNFIVNAGTLSLDNQGATRFPSGLTVAQNATARFTGTGTTQLALTGGTSAGNYAVEEGIFNLDGSVTNLDGTATINVGSGATLYTYGVGPLTYDRITGAGTLESSYQATTTAIGTLQIGTFNANRYALAVDQLEVSGTTTVANSVSLTVGDGFTDTLTYGTSNPLTVTGVFTINTALNAFSQLTKAGAGTLDLGFGGTINNLFKVDAGTLGFTADTTYTSTISGAGAVEIHDPSLSFGPAVTFAQDQTYTGGTTIERGRLILGNGGATGSVVGNIHLQHSGLSGLVFNRSGETTLTNTLTGYGWIGQASTGTLAINSDLTFTNDEVSSVTPFDDQREFRVTGGTLRLDDGAAGIGEVALSTGTTLLLNNATAAVTVDGDLTGAGSVTKQAAANATLAGTNTYTGTTTVNAGTLTLTGANPNAGGTTVGQNSGDTATLALTGTATLAGNVTNRATGTVSLSDTAALTGSLVNNGVLSLNRTGNYTLALTPTGTGEIAQNGDGDLLLGSAAQTNNIRINSGRVGLTYNTDLTLASKLGGAGRFYHTGTTLTLTGGTFARLDGFDVASGSIVRLEGGTDYDTDFALDAVARLNTALNLYYDRNITGTGLMTVESGTFALTGGSINLGTGLLTIANGATLALSGNSAVTATVANSGLIDFDNESNYVFGSAVSGTGAFLVNHSGRVELTAANTATGGATIAANSTLALSGAGAVGGTIANAGTLEIVSDVATPRTVPTNLSGNGAMLLSGGGDIVFSSSPTYAGQTLLSDGTTIKVGTITTATFANAITGYGNLHTGNQGTTLITGNAAFGYDSATGLGGNVTVGGGSTLQVGDGGTTGTLFAGNTLLVNGTLAFHYANNHQSQLSNFSGPGTVRVMDTAPTSDNGALLLVSTDNAGFTGTMQVDAGARLQLGNGGTTGSIYRDGLSFAQNGTFAVDGTLLLDRSDDFNFNYQLTGASTGKLQDLNGDFTLTGRLAFNGLVQTAGNLTFNSGATTSFVGRFSGLNATNLGWLTLVGDTNYSGGTFTNSGVLTIGNGASGSFLGTIANSGTLFFNRDAGTDLTVGNLGANKDITGTGQIVQQGGNVLTVAQNVTASSFAVTSGVLNFEGTVAARDTATIDGSGTGIARFTQGTFGNIINASTIQTVGTVALENVASAGSVSAQLSGASGALTLGRNGSATDLSLSSLTGNAAVHFVESGKLTLATGSTNTGALTTVGNFISVGGGLAADRVDFTSAGTNVLEFTNAIDAASASLVTGMTEFRKSGAGLLTFTGTFGNHATTPVNVDSALTLNVSGGTLDVSSATLNRDLHLALATGGTLDIGNRGSSVLSLSGDGGSLLGSGNISIDQIFYRGSLSGFNQLTTQGGELGALTGINSLIKNYSASGTNRLDILGDASGAGLVKINAGDVSFYGTADFDAYLDVNTTGNPGGFTSVTFRENASFGNGVFGDVVISDADVNFMKNVTADYFVVNNGGELRLGGLATATDNSTTSFSIFGNSYLRLGANASLAAGNDIFLQNSTLTSDGTFTFASDRLLTVQSSTLSGSFIFNSVIAGSAADTLNYNGGRLTLAGNSAYVGTLAINSGTLVLGNVAAVDLARTNFSANTAFDVNGTNWSADLLNFNQVTVANSAASAVTLSSTIGTNSWFGLDGGTAGLSFTGTIAGAGSVGVHTSGNVTLATAPFAQISSLAVQGGTTQVGLAAFANPTTVALSGTGALSLNAPDAGTFTNAVTIDSSGLTGDAAALLNQTGAALTISSNVTTTDSTRLATTLLGGDDNTTFTGTLSGEGSLMKVGAGTLTFTPASIAGWNAAHAGARLGVREGTLITNLATLNDRRLVIEDTGVLQLTDSAANTLQIAALDGNGTLDLGSRSLEFRGQNYVTGNPVTDFTGTVGNFTGTLTTLGDVTFNSSSGQTFGPKYLEQKFGTLNASTLRVNVGSITVLDALNVSAIYFGGGGSAGGVFRSTVNGISNAAHTDLTAQFYRIVGRVSLIGGSGLTSNSGSMFLEAAGAEVVDDATGNSIFNYITSNTGNIIALGAPGNGVSIQAGVSAFTNQSSGTISLSESEWVSAGSFINRGSLSLANSSLTATSFAQNAGTLSASGTLFAPLTVNGGALEIGGSSNSATLTVQGSVTLNPGSVTRWEFAPLNGTAVAAGTDLLQVTNSVGQTDGTLTFGAASAKQPLIVQLDASSFPYDANFTQSHTWAFATTTHGVIGFDPASLLVRTRNGFNLANAVNGQGNFGLQVVGNDVNVVYDPSTVLNVASGTTSVDTPITASGTYGLGGLTKSGGGTLAINVANTYTGATQMLGGTLQIGHNSALSTGTVFWNSGTIRSDGTARSLANTIYLQGNLTVAGTSDLTFAGSLTNVADSNRTLTVNNTGLTTFGDIIVTGSPTSNAATPALTVNVATGSTAIVAGAIADGLRASGLNKNTGTGTLALTGANTYSGLTTVNAGTLQLGHGGTTGSINGDVVVNTNGTLAFNRSNASTFAGTISGAGQVTQLGTGVTTLTGTHTYTGATTVNAGTLLVNGSVATSAFTVNAGGTLGGSGTIGSLALVSGAILSPGNSPGALSTGSETWNGGATYVWEVNNATGTAGTHYDLLSISGALNIAATSSNRFTLSLTSLALGDVAGDVINFNAAQNYTYTIASTTTGIVGFDASAFTINSSAFSNVLAGGTWSLSLTNSNRDLALNFTAAAIPEPSTYAAIFGTLACLAVVFQRRRALALAAYRRRQ